MCIPIESQSIGSDVLRYLWPVPLLIVINMQVIRGSNSISYRYQVNININQDI